MLYGKVEITKKDMNASNSFIEAFRTELENCIGDFSKALTYMMYTRAFHITAKQRNRIFRRRDKAFRNKWWITYRRLQKHKHKMQMRAIAMAPNPFINTIRKKSKVWSEGRTYSVPFNFKRDGEVNCS